MNVFIIFKGISEWPWLAKWRWFGEIQFGVDLVSVLGLPLGMLVLRICKCLFKVGQHQNDHFDVFLQTMQKDQEVWFRKSLVWMLKVVIMLIM